MVRKLVSRQAKFVPQTPTEPRSDGAGPDSVGENCQAPPPAPAPKAPEKLAVVEPLAPARYKVQFTASAEFRDKIERLSALMPGVDLASVMEAAVSEKLERLEAKRFGKTKNTRKSLEEADTSPGVRGISAPVRRFVWERDGGQCTYETKDGRRCPAREGVEFHHDEPYGVGGDRSAENIRLACKTHNGYMAELDFGKDKMDRYRRSADRVREPRPTLQLRLDRQRESRSQESSPSGPSGPSGERLLLARHFGPHPASEVADFETGRLVVRVGLGDELFAARAKSRPRLHGRLCTYRAALSTYKVCIIARGE